MSDIGSQNNSPKAIWSTVTMSHQSYYTNTVSFLQSKAMKWPYMLQELVQSYPLRLMLLYTTLLYMTCKITSHSHNPVISCICTQQASYMLELFMQST